MIHSARPTVPTVAITWKLFCEILKSGDGWKIVITNSRDCGSASWINWLVDLLLYTYLAKHINSSAISIVIRYHLQKSEIWFHSQQMYSNLCWFNIIAYFWAYYSSITIFISDIRIYDFWPTRPRPYRWSLFSHIVSVHTSVQITKHATTLKQEHNIRLKQKFATIRYMGGWVIILARLDAY